MSWSALIDHMEQFHPNADRFGDQGTGSDMWCQLCGGQYLKDGKPVSAEEIRKETTHRKLNADSQSKGER